MFQRFNINSSSVPISILGDFLSRVADVGKTMGAGRKMLEAPLMQHCKELLDKEGEATGLAQASYILERYQHLSIDGKRQFFLDILNDFGMDTSKLDDAIAAWKNDKSESSARSLHFSAEPQSQNLIRKLNQAPNATLSLVNMRADLIGLARTDDRLKALDQDFLHLFNSWFNRGFLQLQRIGWETPAAILEKIIAYEAVHEIRRWKDLRNRVAAPDRRLYGYFHPALGMEPLIFVEVALTAHKPTAIQPILTEKRDQLPPQEATSAVFYSISNCQSGLKGISFGNFLIKQVVESLQQEFANLKIFITLSPIPGFRKWALQQHKTPDPAITEQDLALINKLEKAKSNCSLPSVIKGNKALKKLAAKYLIATRSHRGGATDPVSRFHLGNGARLEDIHTHADTSPNGLENAWGCMVNYQYHIPDVEKNHEAYANENEIIASSKVMNLLK